MNKYIAFYCFKSQIYIEFTSTRTDKKQDENPSESQQG